MIIISYRIEVVDGSGNIQSIDTYTKLLYGGSLNGTHFFDIVIRDTSSVELTKFAKGNTVNIYRKGSLDLKGIIDKRRIISDGFMRIQGIGYGDKKCLQAKAPKNDSTTWSSNNTNGIIGDIIAKQPSITANVVDNQAVTSFRSDINQSCLYAVSRFCRLSGQDFSFDYANDEIDIENHHGSATTIGILNDGIDINRINVNEDDRKKVEKVTVVGKSEGGNQIQGSYGPSFSQGDTEETFVDKTIESVAEANAMAQEKYDILNNTRFTYSFNVLDPHFSFTLGDIITVYSDPLNLDTNLRITMFKRSVTPKTETLTFEVRGTGEREAAEDRVSKMLLQRRAERDANTLKQGTDDGTGNLSTTGGVTDAPSVTGVTGGVTNTTLQSTAGVSVWHALTVTTGSHKAIGKVYENVIGSVNFEAFRAAILILNATGSSQYITPKVELPSGTVHTYDTNYTLNNNAVYGVTTAFSELDDNTAGFFKFWDDNYNASSWTGTFQNIYSHTHGTHGHSDSFDTSDSNHPHSDDLDSTDSGHNH